MSSYLNDLARWCAQRGGRVLAAVLILVGVLAGVGVAVMQPFDDGFEVPGSSSQEAFDQLGMTFPEVQGTRVTMVIVAPEGQTMDDPQLRQAVADRLDQAQDELEYVDTVLLPWDELAAGAISEDNRAGMANLTLSVQGTELTDANRDELFQLSKDVEAEVPGATVRMGGDAFSTQVPKLSIVEVVGLGVALVVLVITLGSLLAAGMPLVMAILGVGAAVSMILLTTAILPVNSTTPMLAVMLGLAVGIDYALFILSRHRDQLSEGMPVEESIGRAVGTAGSAVVFAGVTNLIALLGLSVAGIPFLTVMGIFAAVAVAFAVLLAITLLPAMLGLAGERLRPKPRKAKKNAAPKDPHKSVRSRWVRAVTKWPLVTVVIVLVALGTLSYQGKDLQLALPNAGQASTENEDRQAWDLISDHFGVGWNGMLVVSVELVNSDDPLGVMEDLKSEIEQLPGVQEVPLATPNMNADTGIVQVVPTTGPDDERTNDLVLALREHEQQWQERYGVATAVTGFTAIALDVSTQLGEALLPFGIFVVGLTLILLTIVMRSIIVPIKAALGYLLSVGAAFGAVTLVFNKGIGGELINIHEGAAVISFLPIIAMALLFGLAMDYEVFLVARMREEYVHGRGEPKDRARKAVHDGFTRSAKVVTAAAVIMFAVFAFFVPEGMGAIKQVAFALAVGVAVDAFIVRMTLVPAVMQLLGQWAWWTPTWLEKRMPHFDVEGEAIEHQVAMADWPAPGDTHILYTRGLSVSDDTTTWFRNVDLALQPGEVLVVRADPEPRLALLLAVSGRLRANEGEAKVAGFLLASQPHKVRRAVTLLDAADAELPRQLSRAASMQAPLVIINGVDIAPSSHRQAIAAYASQLGRSALILGVQEESDAAALLPQGYSVIDLGPGPDQTPPDTNSSQLDSTAAPREGAHA
ncbi:MMPL family transporter [Parenemella sanctibonifatiensis]|uniref:Transporter n=1 Tax=Parenemella sanctibonifatiensis TaxID=2016505 RepID=A0A255ECU2_9ACTN|nr:MMPL family transporter [Parenemella sanctibonifatiensis]OYN89368.1 transporter [Parenemella sanctibonifatiensis]